MLIKSITLNNYRLYKGKNTISFDFNEKKMYFSSPGKTDLGKPLSYILYFGAYMDV